MSRTTFAPRETNVGNGSVSAYTFNFKIEALAQLLVIETNTTNVEVNRVRGTDTSVLISSVTFDAVEGGGTINLLANLTLNHNLYVLQANDSPTQDSEWKNKGDFTQKRIENDLDFQAGSIQRLAYRAERAVEIDETIATAAFDPTLPIEVIETTSRVIQTKADGTGFEIGPSAAAISGAAADAAAAAASASAASTSETNAATSETNAASSASAAAATLASAYFRDVVYKTFADSPITLAQADNGKLFSFDTSGGAIVVNAPTIASLALPFNIAMLLAEASNTVTINRGGTDTIQGATSKVLSAVNTGFQLIADDDAAPDDWSVLEFGTVANASITRVKTAQGGVARRQITSVTANYTALTASDDIILVDAISNDVTVTLPTAVSDEGRNFLVKRIDDTGVKLDTFVDGDVTVGTDNINIATHPFIDLQRIQLTTTGVLPAGLSLATDYYIILVDANNIKLAASRADAIADTAVDITAAAGGGTHTATSEVNNVLIDGDGTETIDTAFTTVPLNSRNDFAKIASDNVGFVVVASNITPTLQTFLTGSGTYTTPNGVKYLKLKLIGGGGGGAGSGSSAGSAAGTGGDTTIDTTLLVGNGGVGGVINAAGGEGGTAAITLPATGVAVSGGVGGSAGGQATSLSGNGGDGASSAFGGGGLSGGSTNATSGETGKTNTGAGGGGGGGGSNGAIFGGSGGGSGAYVEAFIFTPKSSYAYAVGAGGTAGGAGASGAAGGPGGSGVIIIEEYY